MSWLGFAACALTALGLLTGCRKGGDCGPERHGLDVLVEGNALARGKLSLARGKQGEAHLSLVLSDKEGSLGAAMKGRGVCKDRTVAVELDPGTVLPNGSQLVGGQVVLVNGALDEGRVFGTWDVTLKGLKGDLAARGFLSTGRAAPVPAVVAAASGTR